jgi:YesN/AraC family two-component response regulator
MPESSGVEMLAYAKKVCPETICILLTGHADTEVLAESINTGNIRRYYQKPVDPAAFIQDMEEFVRDYENRKARSSTENKKNAIFRRTLDTSRKSSGADVGSSYCTEKTKDDKPRLLVQNSGTHSHSLPTMGSELPMDEDLERIGLTLDSVYRYQKLHYAQLEARLASKSDSEKINRTIMKAELAEECNKVLADIRITKKALINLSSQKVITHPD